jgi:hypothetical protein
MPRNLFRWWNGQGFLEVIKKEKFKMIKPILITLVVIALIFLVTISTAGSYSNESGKVWSDGYVELTLNKMERTDTLPTEFIEFITTPKWARTPEVGHDFVVINLTLTRIEGRYVLPVIGGELINPTFVVHEDRYFLIGGEQVDFSLLFDAKGDNYTSNYKRVGGG